MSDDILKLESFLKGMRKPVLSCRAKSEMRGRVMSQVTSEKKVVEFIEAAREESFVGSGVLSRTDRAFMKERLMTYITDSRRNLMNWLFVFGKRFVGVSTLAVFLFGIFGVSIVNIHVAMAETFTIIEAVSGNVVVQRDGVKLIAKDDMILKQGDLISTDGSSAVNIKFLDDSIARLDGNTTIALNKLFEDASNISVTNVEVEVKNGDVWSRVLNLFTDDSTFSVRVGDAYISAKKAAFNTHKDANETKIEVYSSVVDLKTFSKSAKKVKSGEAATVRGRGGAVMNSISGNKEDTWVKSNLEKDKVHIAKVGEDNADALKDSVGMLPENALYSLKTIKSGVVQLLTFDDISKKKLELEDAERKFVEWSLLLKDGKANEEDVSGVFDGFVSQVGKFESVIVGVRESGDAKYADELEVYLKSELDSRESDLKAVLPDSPLYAAKECLYNAKIAAADNDGDKALVKKELATTKLGEAQDLVDVGDNKLAAQTIGDYAKVVGDVNKDVSSLSDAQKTEVAPALADTMVTDKDILSSIQNTSNEQDVNKVAVQVEKLVVDPMAKNLSTEIDKAEDKAIEVAKAAAEVSSEVAAGVATDAITPVVTSSSVGSPSVASTQHESEYGVPVVGSGDNEKPLDPLLDLSK